MMHVMEYRQHAEQCRAMAKTARNRIRRAQFLELAKQWEDIADEREKLLELERKVGKPLTSDTGLSLEGPPRPPPFGGQKSTPAPSR
jgi:hypothetical protein